MGITVSPRPLMSWLMASTIVVYAMLMFADSGDGILDGFQLFRSVIVYFLSICVYFFGARLAFSGKTRLLVGTSALAVILGFMLAGSTGYWVVLTNMLMVLLGGMIVGHLTASGQPQLRVFFAGLLAVILFSILQYASLWGALMQAASEASTMAMEELKPMMVSLGYNEDAVIDGVERTGIIFQTMVRWIPVFTVLSSLGPFVLGYLWFTRHTGSHHPHLDCNVEFTQLHMPFMVTPLVIVIILTRLLVGGETVVLVADNLLVALTLFYVITGLALVEFYLRRLKISTLTRVLFYIMLFLTQLAGMLASAILGFIDSFFDWRSKAESADAQ